MSDWSALGIRPGELLLPREPYLNHFWPVVALDQYTSQPEVWRAAEQEIGSHPSTLRMVVPEAFLHEARERSLAVYRTMEDYLGCGLFTQLEDSFVLVERETQSGKRIGLVLTIDLEAYDYAPGSKPLIRATEETVLERIPPRLLVREQSALELSHVMLLLDDPGDSVLGPLYARHHSQHPLYDIRLLMQGGRVRGWQVASSEDHAALKDALAALKARLAPGGMLYAVGDGNHSLAAAKAAWEKQKAALAPAQWEGHPARYAMAELVNLHSEALLFEPIHRVAFNTTRQALLAVLAALQPEQSVNAPDLVLVSAEGDLPLALANKGDGLVTEAVQRLLDAAKLPLDYVHGEDAVRSIVRTQGATGLLMPEFAKRQLFPTVERDGRLPRKTFSMGEANEKRFYLEARKIR